MNYATQSVSSGWLSQCRCLKTEAVVKSLMWWFTQEVTSGSHEELVRVDQGRGTREADVRINDSAEAHLV